METITNHIPDIGGEVKSMGRNGTRIKVLNGKALKEIAEYRVWGDK